MFRAVVYAVVMVACNVAMDVYPARLREVVASMVVRTVVSFCLLGVAALTLLYYLVPQWYLGRGMLLAAVVVSLLLVRPMRYLFFAAVGVEALRRGVVFIGAGERQQR